MNGVQAPCDIFPGETILGAGFLKEGATRDAVVLILLDQVRNVLFEKKNKS